VIKQGAMMVNYELRKFQESETLMYLSMRYPAVIELIDAARECGRAHQTFLNELSSGRCKLNCFKQGRRWYVRLIDLAQYIDGHFQTSLTEDVEQPVAIKRGRPSKSEQIERRKKILQQHLSKPKSA
jgi:hypothetical protein